MAPSHHNRDRSRIRKYPRKALSLVNALVLLILIPCVATALQETTATNTAPTLTASSTLSAMTPDAAASAAEAAAHNQVTLDLAKKECAEHMEGMGEAASEMSKRSLIIKAYSLDDPNGPAVGVSDKNVKIVHFVRHGQGFHNLMADLAKAEGREWVQVRKREMSYLRRNPT